MNPTSFSRRCGKYSSSSSRWVISSPRERARALFKAGVHLHARFQNIHLLGLVSDPVAHLFELGAQSLQGANLLVQPPRFRFMSGPLGLMLGFVRVPFRVAPAAFELHRGNDVLERLQ